MFCDKGVQRLCETRQTEQRRKRRVRINPRRAALLSLYELHLLMRAKRESAGIVMLISMCRLRLSSSDQSAVCL